MSAAASLLSRLDAALAAVATEQATGWHASELRDAGIDAAAALNDLLVRHQFGWSDVLTPGSRLAKLCGRLGSEFPAEREAAYDHAARLILRQGARWSSVVQLPAALARPPAPTPPAAPAALDPPTRADKPPERDWITTVRHLKARTAWRTPAEHELLDSLEISLAEGHAVSPGEARWLRDIWWTEELNHPDPKEAPE